MKTVKVVNTITGTPVTISTDATTFGQLKREMSGTSQFRDINWGNTVVYQRDSQGRSTKSLDDESISSEPSFTLYISPSKHKGGIYSPAVVNDLRQKMNNIFDELTAAGRTAYSSVANLGCVTAAGQGPKFSRSELNCMDYAQLTGVIAALELDTDPTDYDEYDSNDLAMMSDAIADELEGSSAVGKSPVSSVPLAKTGLSYQEQKDLEELAGR